MPEKANSRTLKRRTTKDRVLQARIPEQLDDELRDRAEQLGLSVSTIVRNVLLHTFDLVEGVVTDSTQIAKALTGWDSASTTSHKALPSASAVEPDSEVLGWQEAILNRNGVCETCNTILPMGEKAAIGVPAGPRITFLCLNCLSTLSTPGGTPSPKPPATKKARKRSSKSTAASTRKAAD